MKYTIGIICLIIGFVIGLSAPARNCTDCTDPNATMEYGETGFPKNCRAIVARNIEAYKANEFPVDDIFTSLERNCGENGYSW